MMNVLTFFRNLPAKKCHVCQEQMLEKAECYSNICDECDHPAF